MEKSRRVIYVDKESANKCRRCGATVYDFSQHRCRIPQYQQEWKNDLAMKNIAKREAEGQQR